VKRSRNGKAELLAASYLFVTIFNTHAMLLSVLVIWIKEVIHDLIVSASIHRLNWIESHHNK
jgi:hypothetical protein